MDCNSVPDRLGNVVDGLDCGVVWGSLDGFVNLGLVSVRRLVLMCDGVVDIGALVVTVGIVFKI